MFEIALAKMNQDGVDASEPVSFQAYCLSNKLPPPQNTARYLSVDSKAKLQRELQAANCMVFRLGAPLGERNTWFALAKYFNGWSDYFLVDEYIFRDALPEMFIPLVSFRHLFPFYLLSRFTETSLVNLALTSGLMAHALQVDDPELPFAAATGQGVFSFDFRPHEKIDKVWTHSKGQVEVDSLFTARRRGKETLFVVESKAGNLDSLAKHKLVYPVLAIREKVPDYMPIVPVYLRVSERPDGYHFYFAECEINADANRVSTLSTLRPVRTSHFVMRLFRNP